MFSVESTPCAAAWCRGLDRSPLPLAGTTRARRHHVNRPLDPASGSHWDLVPPPSLPSGVPHTERQPPPSPFHIPLGLGRVAAQAAAAHHSTPGALASHPGSWRGATSRRGQTTRRLRAPKPKPLQHTTRPTIEGLTR